MDVAQAVLAGAIHVGAGAVHRKDRLDAELLEGGEALVALGGAAL
jgi:hypothetical protein